MSENMIDLLIGVADGRVLHYILPIEDGEPEIIELTPKTNNINTEALKIVKSKDFYFVGSANGSVNIWKPNGEQWQKYKTIEMKGKEEYGKKWEARSIACDENLLYTGGPKGEIELWDINNDLTKVDEIKVTPNPIRGLMVNDEAIFCGAGEACFKVLNKNDYSELYTEDFPWAKYRLQNMTMNENFICLALTGRVFSYTFDKETLTIEKHGAFENTHNKAKGLAMFFNICYSVAWDGQIRAWNILSKNPSPILLMKAGSLESVHVDNRFLYIGTHHGKFIVLDKQNEHQVKFQNSFGREVSCIYSPPKV
ncbi:MAG: hypothetical protein GF317_20720 [Candidatus Lokiarchaeota archaeon]|nr:hypothetical protein [Candidatus Lokiarchaeota archaeon]MBD3201889.1 hypothetical protein [Candidatus Lokiarchaeota archaeon]